MNIWSKLQWAFKSIKVVSSSISLCTYKCFRIKITFPSLISLYSFFAPELNLLKWVIFFNGFDSLMFLSLSNCFFPWSSIAFSCFSFLPSIFFSLFKSPSFFIIFIQSLIKNFSQWRILKLSLCNYTWFVFEIFTSQIFILFLFTRW